MTAFLGLSAFHRDAAAALVVDGRVVAAVQEERFSGKPGDASFPRRSVRWCLDEAGLRAGDLDGVVVSQKPLRTFERLLASHLEEFPRSARGFARAMFLWLGDRLWMRSRVAQELEVEAKRVLFCEHARAHAASAAFAAGLDDAAVLVLDDVGEWTTTAQCRVRAGAVEVLAEMRFPDSLGLVASAITQYLGFVPGQDEEVLGALGAHGAPRMLEHLRELVVPLDRGAFRVDRRAFPFRRGGDLAYGDALVEALGPARASGQPLLASGDDTRHADVAASAHALLAERAVDAARALRERVADVPDLALTGFLAQDARIVARVAEQSGFERVHAAPYADDAGAALGAALVGAQGAAFVGPLLGPRAEDDLGEHEGAKELDGADEVPRRIAERLERGELVGWARGRLALGRGALGGRIALASASEEGARARLLDALQLGESWRECFVLAPAERADEWFDVPPAARPAAARGGAVVRPRDSIARALNGALPPDGVVRALLVDGDEDPVAAELLRAAAALGHPVLLGAELRRRGGTIARQEADVVELLGRSGLDAAFVGARLYSRSE